LTTLRQNYGLLKIFGGVLSSSRACHHLYVSLSGHNRLHGCPMVGFGFTTPVYHFSSTIYNFEISTTIKQALCGKEKSILFPFK